MNILLWPAITAQPSTEKFSEKTGAHHLGLWRLCTGPMAVRGPNVPGAMASDSPFDYVFSQAELDDVLMFMERQQDDKSAPVEPLNASVFHGSIPPSSVSLQFQPHPSGGFSGNPFTSLGLDQGLNGAQPYLSQIENDPFSSQAMGHADDLDFDLGVQLEPELNPLHQGNLDLGLQARIKAEPMSGIKTESFRSPLEGSASPSPNHAGSLGHADSLASGGGAHVKTEYVKTESVPLNAAFAKLGSGGLTSPVTRPRQFSSEMHPGTSGGIKRGELELCSHLKQRRVTCILIIRCVVFEKLQVMWRSKFSYCVLPPSCIAHCVLPLLGIFVDLLFCVHVYMKPSVLMMKHQMSWQVASSTQVTALWRRTGGIASILSSMRCLSPTTVPETYLLCSSTHFACTCLAYTNICPGCQSSTQQPLL